MPLSRLTVSGNELDDLLGTTGRDNLNTRILEKIAIIHFVSNGLCVHENCKNLVGKVSVRAASLAGHNDGDRSWVSSMGLQGESVDCNFRTVLEQSCIS